jgi:hypothetical protein
MAAFADGMQSRFNGGRDYIRGTVEYVVNA